MANTIGKKPAAPGTGSGLRATKQGRMRGQTYRNIMPGRTSAGTGPKYNPKGPATRSRATTPGVLAASDVLWGPSSTNLWKATGGNDPNDSFGQQVLGALEDSLAQYGMGMPEFLTSVGYGPFDRQAFVNDWAAGVFGDTDWTNLVGDRGQSVGGYRNIDDAINELLGWASNTGRDYLDARNAERAGGAGVVPGGLDVTLDEILAQIDQGASANSYYY